MDFWFVCPRFTLLHVDGHLCAGPPDDGLGCLACVAPPLARVVEDEVIGTVLRRSAADGLFPRDHRGTAAHRAHALVGRRERLLGMLERAEAVVAPSRFLMKTFGEQGFPIERVRHVPYGVDPDRLVDYVRREPGPTKDVRFGYVGSLMQHKGLHVILEALLALDGDWGLDVHGDLRVHPAYGKELRALAGDDPRVVFHGGFKPTELGRVLSGFDVLVAPSLWHENTPFTVLEAQMAGLPIVASDLGGIAEVVRSGENGALFEAGNVESARAACEALVRDPASIGALRPKAGQRTLTDNLDDFESLYREFSS
jgi:glycosyltransferase involved in cell wall biosynthesis